MPATKWNAIPEIKILWKKKFYLNNEREFKFILL